MFRDGPVEVAAWAARSCAMTAAQLYGYQLSRRLTSWSWME
jgi:hypothetical protein